MRDFAEFNSEMQSAYDSDLAALETAKDTWARTSVADRVAMLRAVKDNLIAVANAWVTAAAKAKAIPEGSALIGEEWISGPYALMSACNGLIDTLSKLEGKAFLKSLPSRELPSGQTAVRVMPHSIWDRLLLSGVKADVWMQNGVTPNTLKDHAAVAYDVPLQDRKGKVALVLGAGNIAAIAPLDALQKLFLENQVVLLKMNPVNDYLTPFLTQAMQPLIDADALRICRGDGQAGAYLTEHSLVQEIHITGAKQTHDLIVWGSGEEAAKNRAANAPKNPRTVTSELGAVCPTIVVPGPWTKADLKFQAENIATMKLHNSGFNCVAMQSLILPKDWDLSEQLMANVSGVISKFTRRAAYYPGADLRLKDFKDHSNAAHQVERGLDTPACCIADIDRSDHEWHSQSEVFGPAFSVKHMHAPDAETYLREAITWANETLYGTLGANILIHPKTITAIGRARFEEIIADLRYGAIAINAWSGVAFLATATPWGAFPGGMPQDIQSGVGTVHNTFMLERTERTVIEAPFRPFPRNVLSGHMTLLPRPPWFVSNTQQHNVGKLLTHFQHKPSFFKLPRIFLHALLG